jgi:hypothetical protein
MIALILAIILVLVILGSIGMGMVIIYHFRRLGMKEDPNAKKFLRIFEIGGVLIIAINILLFFFVVI